MGKKSQIEILCCGIMRYICFMPLILSYKEMKIEMPPNDVFHDILLLKLEMILCGLNATFYASGAL